MANRVVTRVQDCDDVALPVDQRFLYWDAATSQFQFGLVTAGKQGTWVYSTNTVIADPANGKFRSDTLTMGTSTQLALSRLTDSNIDLTPVLSSLLAGDTLYVQDQVNAANWIRYTLTAAPVNNTSWFLLEVTTASGSGTTPGGNAKVLFVFEAGGSTGRSLGGTAARTVVYPPVTVLHHYLSHAAVPVRSLGHQADGTFTVAYAANASADQIAQGDALVAGYDGRPRQTRTLHAIYADIAALTARRRDAAWAKAQAQWADYAGPAAATLWCFAANLEERNLGPHTTAYENRMLTLQVFDSPLLIYSPPDVLVEGWEPKR